MKCRSLFIFLSVIVSFLILTAHGYCISDSLVINEIYYHTDSGASIENQWIEIYNTSGQDIDLSTTSVTIESSTGTDWTGGMAININLSSMVTTGNSIIKANDYFLIANTASIEIGADTITPNMVYDGGRMFYMPNAFTAARYPTRGVRIKVDNEVKDAIMYGLYFDALGNPVEETNPTLLDVDEFYAGSEPDNEVPVLESVPAQWGFARKVDGVDTDENNPDPNGSSDWETVAFENMTPTAGPEVTLPVAACYSIETATEGVDDGMLVFWEVQDAQNVVIYWKEKLSDPWNVVDGDALNDIEVYDAEGMISFFDRNVDPDMPAGDFNTIGSRYYKCGAQY